jgi:hypothetical protein
MRLLSALKNGHVTHKETFYKLLCDSDRVPFKNGGMGGSP